MPALRETVCALRIGGIALVLDVQALAEVGIERRAEQRAEGRIESGQIGSFGVLGMLTEEIEPCDPVQPVTE